MFARLVDDAGSVHEAGPAAADATAPRFAGLPLFVEEALSRYVAGDAVDLEALRTLAAPWAGPPGPVGR